MGNSSSAPVTPQTVYKAASANNVQLLIEVLRKVPSNQLYQFLEPQDEIGWTPLMVAAAKGHTAAVHELLRAGAQVHHVSKDHRSTALHEAVLRSHGDIIDVLLRASANPFLENGSGLTPLDVAINNKQVSIVRRLEQGAAFAGWLTQKVTKYMGLGSEWSDRWCVIMPRFPSGNASQQLTRSLLVVYKGPEQTNPCCKVWLDGARAIPVDDRPDRPPGCNLALHRNHAAPSGAYITGDPSVGYTLHFRAKDASAAEVNKMRRFTDLCNAGASVIARGAQAITLLSQSQPQPQAQPAARPRPSQGSPGPPQRPPPGPTGPPSPQQPAPPSGLTADEAVARQLQAEYDREMAAYLLEHPDDAAMQRMMGQAFNNASPQSSPSTANSQASGPRPAATAATAAPAVGAERVRYPELGRTPSGNPFAPGASSASAPPMASWGTGQDAAAPPASATANGFETSPSGGFVQPQPFNTSSPTSGAVPGGALEDEKDSCVICMSAPVQAGFLHGSSVHKCVCRDCAKDLWSGGHRTCPVCRENIQQVILNFY